MDTSYCKEHPMKQEYFARRKEAKEEEAGSGNSSTDSVNSGSGQVTKFIYCLDWPLREGNL
jgi:hypothetical protein